jgi:hypothetical protein
MCRAERAGDWDSVKRLLERLFQNDYRFIGIDAKVRFPAEQAL